MEAIIYVVVYLSAFVFFYCLTSVNTRRHNEHKITGFENPQNFKQ